MTKTKSDTPNARAKRVKRATAPTRQRKPKAEKPTSGAETKQDMLVGMMSKPGGATSKEMEAATGWLPHSVRGLIGTLKKKGVNVESKKLKGEPTYYRIPGASAAPKPSATVGDVI